MVRVSVRFLFVSSLTLSTKMVRVLNVAEKNDAAKSLSDVLSQGRFHKREGFSKYNKIYEFETVLMNQQVTMTMTSVSGHLLASDFTGSFRKWHSCSPVDLFSVPVEKYCPDNFKDIKRTLEHEVRGCQSLIIWTDCDREGENIGYEIINVCQAVKPTIKVYRAKFSEITPGAVARAINSLGPADQRVSDAVDVRQELDLRIGAAFTRFQTMRLQQIFPNALAEQLISYGSCQFPTLGFVVERYKQVQDFVPEPFWKLQVTHVHDEVNAEFSWKRHRLFNHLACQVLYEHCVQNPLATVIEVRSKTKSKWRPQPLDTVELEKLASRKLKVNAKQTMQIAEKLYTQGLISYPRTETNIFPKDMDLTTLVQEQTRDPNWGEFAQRVLQNGVNPRNGKKTDNAHPPIHPLKYTDTLQGNERKIYEFIVRHFLACVSQDAQGHETVVDIDIAGERFSTQGLMILARNYLDVYPYDKWAAKEVPLYREGDQFEPSTLQMLSGETSPPPLLTEADLIALMEKHGIGTDATHAEHIETVKSRMYVGLRPDGKFVPGQLGMGLVEGYDSMGYEMSKPDLRAELEADLKLICDGLKTKEEVLPVHIEKYKQVFIQACQQAQKLDEALSQYLGQPQTPAQDQALPSTATPSVVMNCKSCGRPMSLRTKKDGKSFMIGCSGYPECKACLWLPEFVLNVSVTEDTCPTCGPGPVKKLQFSFKPGSVPMSIGQSYTGCVGGCDEMLTETLGLRPFPRTQQSPAEPPLPRSEIRVIRPDQNRNPRPVGKVGGQRSLQTGVNSPRVPGSRSLHIGVVTPIGQGFSGHQVRPSRQPTPTRASGHLATPSLRPPQQTAPRHPMSPVSINPGGSTSQAIVCSCGVDARLLTVRKEGPNTGRQFYKCGGQDGCNFFLWADEQTAPDTGNSSTGDLNSPHTVRPVSALQQVSRPVSTPNQMNQTPGIVSCKCGEPGKLLTVNKTGPNIGRQFYGCAKPREASCGFFQWADQEEGAGPSIRQPSLTPFQPRTTNQRSSEGKGSKPRKTPSCGYCGQTGHRKPKCPERMEGL